MAVWFTPTPQHGGTHVCRDYKQIRSMLLQVSLYIYIYIYISTSLQKLRIIYQVSPLKSSAVVFLYSLRYMEEYIYGLKTGFKITQIQLKIIFKA